MTQAHPGGSGATALRLAAFTTFVLLITLGAANLLLSRASPAADEDADFPGLYREVERYLKQHYLDQERIGPRARKLTEKALSMLENMIDEIYVENSDPENPHVVVHVGGKSKVISLARIDSLEKGIQTLEDLTEFFKANYRGKHTLNDFRYFAMNGFLSGLDPHTQVFNPKGFRDFTVHIEGEIFGVGMYVGSNKGQLIVRKVLKGTPAERSGFKRGDRIVKIGEESTVSMDVNEAVKKIRGAEHSKVVLTVKRRESKDAEWVTIPKEVQRERVTIPSVVSKLIPLSAAAAGTPVGTPGKDGSLAYVHVQNFDKNTVPSLKETIESLRRENGGREPAGLILDLRENSGGLLQQAQEMADIFLSSGELYWISQKGREDVKRAKNDRREPLYPIVVLSNELSASGAEIVIGALQKNRRAVVLGTPTFGKGSVQQLHPLGEGGDWQLKITVSEYLIPDKVSIQENGVVPDILAERVVVSDKLINVFPNRRRGTERDYDDHLVSRFKKDEQPAERIQYLFNIEDPEVDDPDAPEPVGNGEIEPEKDTLTQIAMKLVERAAGDPRGPEGFRSDVFLRAHKADLEAIRAERFEESVKGLQERGIDWEEGPNPPTPAVDLTIEHQQVERPSTDKDDPVPTPFLVMKARATNRSDRPLYRLKGITSSDSYSYREQEFLFGKIEAGATVERTVEMRIPYFPFARSDLVIMQVSGPDGKPIIEREHEVVLGGEERPALAYSATLLRKDGAPIDRLQPGVEALLKIKVINSGRAAAHKGVAVLRNVTGKQVFLEPPGRIEFAELGPGMEKELEFSFRTGPLSGPLPGAPPAEGGPEEARLKEYRFELGIFDPYSGESLNREIVIPAEGGPDTGFANGKRFEPPRVEASVAAISSTSGPPTAAEKRGDPGALRVPEAVVTSESEVELTAKVSTRGAPFKVWVTNSPQAQTEREPDKVHFAASPDGSDLSLVCRVPLKKGTNLIHVIADDEDGLQSREVVVVRRRDPVLPQTVMDRIVEAASEVHRRLGPGFRESIYEAALPIELRKRGLRFQSLPGMALNYDQVEIGEYRLDLLVEDQVVVEMAATAAAQGGEALLRFYLEASAREHGLHLNFSAPELEVKRVRSSRVTNARVEKQ